MQKLELWPRVNRRLIAKVIAEMSFEQLLSPQRQDSEFSLSLASGATYHFQAWVSIWGFLRIDPDSVQRFDEKGQETSLSAGQFFIDTQQETQMGDIILGNFLEELHRTVFADIRLLQEQEKFSAAEMIAMDGDALQGLLDGHPKALVNKGRIGWGAHDIERFAPEARPLFQLYWLAVDRQELEASRQAAWNTEALLKESFQIDEMARFQTRVQAEGIDPARYEFMPVHPWQWDQVIRQQFVEAIARRSIIPLGFFGDQYRPQTSLRTLNNVDRPDRLQIKLSLSILNTSCVRGLPAKYVPIAPHLSQWLAQICAIDPVLHSAGTQVLQDVVNMHRQHETFAQVKEAPYRYHEYLGTVWRESPLRKLGKDKQAVITAALFQKDSQGDALIAHWIQSSGLAPEAWLQEYFKTVVVPLFHLQCKYGVGIVAHGQNIVLILEEGLPVGMFLKDLQGDLRLVDEDLPELEQLSPAIKERLTRLPAHYLIHDLQTGHLITVLRFISATLYEAIGFPEEQFYGLLSRILHDYQIAHPELNSRFANRSLLHPTMLRILVNKVRFKIGYADSAERPVPTLGTDLINPLHLSMPGGENHVSPHV